MNRVGVLLAIDERPLLKDLSNLIRNNDLTVFQSINQDDILSRVEDTEIKLLLLDDSLIETELEEYISTIRSINSEVLIILLFKRNNATEIEIENLFKYGIYNYIMEPFSTEIIYYHISNALNIKNVIELSDISNDTKNAKVNIRNAILNNYEDIVFVIQNNRFKYINKAGANLLQYSLDKLRKLSVTDLMPDHYENSIFDILRNCIANNHAMKKEVIFFNSIGDEVHLSTRFIPFEHLNKPAVIAFAREISQTKVETEEMMYLSAAVKSLHSAVTITDINHKIIFINPAHKEIFGYELNELIGKKSNILYPFDEHGETSHNIYEAIQLVGWAGERLGVRKNGEVFPVFEKISAVKDKNKKHIALVSVVEDVTERKKLQKDLQESEERYRNLVESANKGIVAFDEDGKIIFFNTAAEIIFGYDRQQILNNLFEMLIAEKYQWIFKENISKYLDPNNTSFSNFLEMTGRRENGELFPMECSLSVCKIKKRKIYTAIIGDIAERKSLQEQLIHSSKMAAIGELLSGVTHEVRNPLTVVLGYSEILLQESQLNEESKEYIKLIHQQAERATNVMENLLSFSRKQISEKRPISINKILEDTIHLKEYDFRKNNIEISQFLDPDLPCVMANENELQQVFLNLLINAEDAVMEASNNKEINIKSSSETNSEGSGYEEKFVNIYIEDSGCGIDQLNIGKIFDPFFSTKPAGAGTGLGLSVSYGIIKDHGGDITVVSTVNKGTIFKLTFPVLQNDQINSA